jgi:Endonuclease-reverse transcriptase
LLNIHDLIFITETWLTDALPSAIFCNNTNYNLFRRDRITGERGGGVACFAKKYLKITVYEKEEFEQFELICLDSKLNRQNYRFCCVYVPPSYSDIMKTTLFEKIDIICLSNSKQIIIGDFNEPNVNWANPDPFKHIIVETMFRNDLHQIIEVPTREDKVLDLLFITDTSCIETVSLEAPFSNSDHNSIEFYLNIKKPVEKIQYTKRFYDADYHVINSNLATIDWTNLFASCASIDDFWRIFSDVLNEVIETFIPATQINRYRKGIPKFLMSLLKKKRKLWKKIRLSDNAQNRKKI